MRIRYLAWTFSLILLVTGAARGDTVDPPQPPDLCAPLDATGVQGIDTAVPGGKLILHATGLADEYIVVLKKAPRQAKAATQAANLDSSDLAQPVESLARELTGTYGGHYRSIYEHALRAFSAALTLDQARAIAADKRVKNVEQVTPIHGPVVQAQAPSPVFPVTEYFPQLNTPACGGWGPSAGVDTPVLYMGAKGVTVYGNIAAK